MWSYRVDMSSTIGGGIDYSLPLENVSYYTILDHVDRLELVIHMKCGKEIRVYRDDAIKSFEDAYKAWRKGYIPYKRFEPILTYQVEK